MRGGVKPSCRKGFGAFTLAEILITLGIIGVISALTIPNLMYKHQEKVLVKRLTQTYAIFGEAYKNAVYKEGPANTWDIGTQDSAAGALKLYNIFKPHLQLVDDCGLSTGCFYKGQYKSLSGNSYFQVYPYKHSLYARGQLKNGVSFFFWSNGSGCPDNNCGTLGVDLNGVDPPNQSGIDFFYFGITNDDVYPNIPFRNRYGSFPCKYNDNVKTNGLACTAWVILKQNMDYRRKDVSAEMAKLKIFQQY